jgi:hypothetical protein
MFSLSDIFAFLEVQQCQAGSDYQSEKFSDMHAGPGQYDNSLRFLNTLSRLVGIAGVETDTLSRCLAST